MLKKLLLMFGTTLVGSGLLTSFAYAQGVRDTVVLAISNHPSVQSSEFSLKAQQYAEEEGKASYFPQISASFTAGRVYQDNSTSRGLTVDRGAAYSGFGEGNLAVRQMVFDGFETGNRVDAARARVDNAQSTLLQTKGDVVLRAVQSHIQVLRAKSALKIINAQHALNESYLSRISDLVSDGGADATELQQAQDLLMVVAGTRADYEGQLAMANAAYMEVTGQGAPEVFSTPETYGDQIIKDVASAIEYAKSTHPSLKAAQTNSEAAHYEMKAEQGTLYPDVNAELSYLKSDKKDLVGGESVDARAVFRMNWDFSTGGREIGAIRKKREEYYEALSNSRVIERELERDIYQAYASLHTVAQKFQLITDRVALNEELMTTYHDQFEASRITLLSLMRAENQLFGARIEKSDTIYSLLLAEYTLLSRTGQIWDILAAESAL